MILPHVIAGVLAIASWREHQAYRVELSWADNECAKDLRAMSLVFAAVAGMIEVACLL